MATPKELADRHRFFSAALVQFSNEVNVLAAPDGVAARDEAVEYACALYFLISDAYKARRVFKPDEHRTEPYKVAAITSATLVGACLLEPKDPNNVRSELVALSNEYFSVYCAGAIMGIVHWDVPLPVLRRHYISLQCMELDVCRHFETEVSRSPEAALAIKSLTLSQRDLFAIDQLVNIYMGWWSDY